MFNSTKHIKYAPAPGAYAGRAIARCVDVGGEGNNVFFELIKAAAGDELGGIERVATGRMPGQEIDKPIITNPTVEIPPANNA